MEAKIAIHRRQQKKAQASTPAMIRRETRRQILDAYIGEGGRKAATGTYQHDFEREEARVRQEAAEADIKARGITSSASGGISGGSEKVNEKIEYSLSANSIFSLLGYGGTSSSTSASAPPPPPQTITPSPLVTTNHKLTNSSLTAFSPPITPNSHHVSLTKTDDYSAGSGVIIAVGENENADGNGRRVSIDHTNSSPVKGSNNFSGLLGGYFNSASNNNTSTDSNNSNNNNNNTNSNPNSSNNNNSSDEGPSQCIASSSSVPFGGGPRIGFNGKTERRNTTRNFTDYNSNNSNSNEVEKSWFGQVLEKWVN